MIFVFLHECTQRFEKCVHTWNNPETQAYAASLHHVECAQVQVRVMFQAVHACKRDIMSTLNWYTHAHTRNNIPRQYGGPIGGNHGDLRHTTVGHVGA